MSVSNSSLGIPVMPAPGRTAIMGDEHVNLEIQKLIYLHLSTARFMELPLQHTGLID